MSSSDDRDENTRVGLWVAFGAAFLVVAGVVGGVVVKQLGGDKPAAAPAAASAPAPAAPAAAADVELIDAPLQGELAGTLYFELGKADLPTDAEAALKKVQEALTGNQRRVVISGFHDASGDPAVNQALAKQRAVAVRQALIAAGADAQRVQLRKPESTTGDGPAEQARRVELRLVD